MGQTLFIAIAAGAASALLAAGIVTGSMLVVPLFYLAPLPVMIAGMAFSPLAALIAVGVAALGLLVAFDDALLLAYVVGIGGPAFGLAYAAMLAREAPAGRDGLVWFPVGGLVALAAAFATLGIVVALFSMAGDYESYLATVTAAFDALMASPLPPPASQRDPAAIGALVARILPPTTGVLSMVSLLVCLYLAGRAALVSGRLARPWPTLSAFRLPQPTSLVLAVAVGLSMAPGMAGLSASVAAATLAFCYALAGFAVVHALTRGLAVRILVLSGLWVTTLMLGWPLIAMAVLGFVDAMFDLRSRMASGHGPPAANDR